MTALGFPSVAGKSMARQLSVRGRVSRVASLLPILAKREIRTRYRTSALDLAWSIITPVTMMAVYGFILTRSFNVTSACGPYLSSAWTGLVLWTAFATAVGTGVYSLIGSADVITKVYFPLESMPLAMVAASLIDLAVGVVTMVALALVQGVPITGALVTGLLPLAVLIVWSAVIAIVASVIAVFVRDVVHGVNLAIRVGFFATPVMYESTLLPASLAWSAKVNPVAVAIDGMRSALLCGNVPSIKLLGAHLAAGLALLVLAVGYTRSIESRVVDVV